ncbi:MAG: AbiV family abortive infection protein [Bdellovibrionales bacterium]
MDQISRDKLLINERKAAAKLRPKPGELVQAASFAFLNAKDYLDSAKALLQAQPHHSYICLIAAIEELGKLIKVIDLLISWKEPQKVKDFLSRHKNHEWKMRPLVDFFIEAYFQQPLQAEFIEIISKKFGIKDVESLLSFLEHDPTAKLHEIRLSVSYTGFDGRIAVSPHHAAQFVEGDLLKLLVNGAAKAFTIIDKILSELLAVLWQPIRECFFEKDRKKAGDLKREINRRVDRAPAAVRKAFNDFIFKKFGISIEALEDIAKLGDPKGWLTHEEFLEFAIDVKRLILS